jgi:hypothetical protein
MAAPPPKAYQLFGIISLHGAPQSFGEGTSVVPFRDLGAIVAESPYLRLRASTDRIVLYRRVVEAVFGTRTILPAPFGTVFRSRDGLIRWLELHYFTLLDALGFIEDRVMTRVKVSSDDQPSQDASAPNEKAVELEQSVAESFRVLRRHAIATIPLSHNADHAGALGASFLIERERWSQFADVVKEETKRLPALHVEQSGPWPPYDFVRMEFGG